MWIIEEVMEFFMEGLINKIVNFFVGNISETNESKTITEIVNKSYMTVAN